MKEGVVYSREVRLHLLFFKSELEEGTDRY